MVVVLNIFVYYINQPDINKTNWVIKHNYEDATLNALLSFLLVKLFIVVGLKNFVRSSCKSWMITKRNESK